MYLNDLADFIFDHPCAFDEIRVSQANFIARIEPVIFGRRRFSEIVLLDVEHLRERNLASPCARVFRIIDCLHLFYEVIRVIINHKLKWFGDSHPARRMFIEVIAYAILQECYIRDDTCIGCSYSGNAHALDKIDNSLRRIAATPHAGQRRHPRIVPAAYVFSLYELE